MEVKGEPCNRIITLENSFHGRTVITFSATGQDIFHQNFFPFTEEFCYVPANDIQTFHEAVDHTVCAVMIELVQGESGVNVLAKEYVKSVERVCKENGILLIVDEVQTGAAGRVRFYAVNSMRYIRIWLLWRMDLGQASNRSTPYV
ncbi:aminotransferase class III-fold pyridoxal phosphate-dependent enzyme [Lachnospiraceae bacterium 45-W7]